MPSLVIGRQPYGTQLELSSCISSLLNRIKLHPSIEMDDLIYDVLEIHEIINVNNVNLFEDDGFEKISSILTNYINLLLDQIGGIDYLLKADTLILTQSYHLCNKECVIDLTTHSVRDDLNMWEYNYVGLHDCHG